MFVVSGKNNSIEFLCDKQDNLLNTYAVYAKVDLMETLAGIRIFARVVEAGSLSEAGS